MNIIKIYFILGVLVAAFFLVNSSVVAQSEGIGVAVYVPIDGIQIDGTVICGTEGSTNKPCEREYDPNMIGVVSDNPAVSFTMEGSQGSLPLLSSGKTHVLVSSANGVIKKGDFVTSSKVLGVAQKASKSGYVLGSALDDYNETDTTKTGKIMISLSLKPAVLKKGAEANLLQMIKDGVEGAFDSPLSALRYFVAALISSVTFIYGFIHFGKIAKSGVESIGRNPLASKSIQMGVIMNMGITVAIMIGSIAVSYFILIF